MTKMARITKPLEQRRQEIIDTSRALFFENGFDKTQVADISKKMNVASGLVYHYFKSKTDILYAVIDELAEEKRLETQKMLDKSNGSALERLRLIFSYAQYSNIHEKFIGGFSRDKAFTEYCKHKIMTASQLLLCSLIEEGNGDGSWDCEYPNEIAVFILHGLAAVTELKKKKKEIGGKSRIFQDVILRVLGVGTPDIGYVHQIEKTDIKLDYRQE
jgi:AcrR family transcriptional regulator